MLFNLADPWTNHFGSEEFATYEFGSTRIDSVLVSQELTRHITRIGYSPVGLFVPTDHRAVIIEFAVLDMFGAHVDNIPAVRFRGTTSTNIAAATKLIDTAYKHLLANNAFARGDKLDPEDPSSTIQVESLDQLIGEAGVAGDAANSGRRPEWRSSPLVQ